MKKKSYSTSDGYQARDLVHYGVDHIKAAKVLFEKEASLFDSGGYLAHLGLELLLKAWLLEVSSEFPKTHSLVALVNKLNERQKQIVLSEEDKTLLRLIDEYGELRYPTPTNQRRPGTRIPLGVRCLSPAEPFKERAKRRRARTGIDVLDSRFVGRF